MAASSRLVLIVGAALFGGFVALLGGGFSRAVEPERYSTGMSVFWLLVGVVFSAPFWLPAMIPSPVCRWISAILLLVPAFVFGGSTWHNVGRRLSNVDASTSVLVQVTLLTVTCLVCITALVWPEVRAYAKRTTASSASASPCSSENRDGAA
jgi:TctA family transporter